MNAGYVVTVDARYGAQLVDLLAPPGRIEVDDGIRAEGRAHVAGPSRCADRLVVIERISRRVGGAQHLDVEPLEQTARPHLRLAQAVRDLIVDGLGVRAGQLFLHAEHVREFVRQPQSGWRATKQVKMLREGLPDLPVIQLHRAAVRARDAHLLQGDTLRIEHAEDVMIGDEQQIHG